MHNSVQLIGNLGFDPEVKRLQSGMAVAKFTLATSKRVKQQDGEYKEITQWHNLILWDKKAEVAEKYLKKGSKIFVTGEIEYRNYENKDGQKVYVTEIVVNELKMLDGKKDGDKNDYPSNEPKAGAKQETNNDDIFGNAASPESRDGLGNLVNTPYSCNVCYKVKSGKYEGKEFDIQHITAERIEFKFISGESMSFDKATFDSFFKICESSDLPF